MVHFITVLSHYISIIHNASRRNSCFFHSVYNKEIFDKKTRQGEMSEMTNTHWVKLPLWKTLFNSFRYSVKSTSSPLHTPSNTHSHMLLIVCKTKCLDQILRN